MNVYTIVFIGKDQELYDTLIQSLAVYEFSYCSFDNLDKFAEFSSKNIVNLIMLSGDSESMAKDESFKKLLVRKDRKIPVFIFSRPALYYARDKDFAGNLVEKIKQALGQNILPRKQAEFGVIKLGKSAKVTSEKREAPRLRASVPFELYADETRTKKIDARLRNISAGGLSVNTKTALPDRDLFFCCFSIEEGEKYALKAVKLRSTLVGDHYHTALRFSKISSADYNHINSYARIIDFLKNTRIFEEFSDDDLRLVVRAGKKIFVREGQIVFSENIEGRNFYIVLSGKIKISRNSLAQTSSGEKYLATMHPGEFFGEMALLRKMKRSAAAQALMDSVLFQIDRNHLEHILLEHQDIALKLYRTFVSAFIERLDNSNQSLIDSPFSIPAENLKL
ncbi:MAG: cyclic nucleotide-binding domain-containing protein [Elusimicrobiota bacterium]|nr:cyclic nucleotide-binding domain-containing protein [Elusimicrobiota bacterium]